LGALGASDFLRIRQIFDDFDAFGQKQ